AAVRSSKVTTPYQSNYATDPATRFFTRAKVVPPRGAPARILAFSLQNSNLNRISIRRGPAFSLLKKPCCVVMTPGPAAEVLLAGKSKFGWLKRFEIMVM